MFSINFKMANWPKSYQRWETRLGLETCRENSSEYKFRDGNLSESLCMFISIILVPVFLCLKTLYLSHLFFPSVWTEKVKRETR